MEKEKVIEFLREGKELENKNFKKVKLIKTRIGKEIVVNEDESFFELEEFIEKYKSHWKIVDGKEEKILEMSEYLLLKLFDIKGRFFLNNDGFIYFNVEGYKGGLKIKIKENEVDLYESLEKKLLSQKKLSKNQKELLKKYGY